MEKTWQSIINSNKITIDEQKMKHDVSTIFSTLFSRLKNDDEIAQYFSDFPYFIDEILDQIPSFLDSLSIKIKPFKQFCYSCIITDEEVTEIASKIHSIWLDKMTAEGLYTYEQLEGETTTNADIVHFELICESRNRFYREIVYCIPVVIKELQFELEKTLELEFFNDSLTEQIAHSLHARYRYLMNNESMQQETKKAYELTYLFDSQYNNLEFDQLSESIKNANIDSAYHISTKLLSIGYYLEKADRSQEPNLLILDANQIETMSKLEHERWAWEKRLSGFIYGKIKTEKTHYCLVPYEQLSEFEKSKDRDQVEQYPIILKDLGYDVKPINEDKLYNVSYQRRIQSNIEKSIFKIEKQCDELKNSLNVDTNYNKYYNEIIENTIINLNEAIDSLIDVRDGIRRSEQTQQSIFASKLFFKTCLPDSFILYKPLDVVSGDFYFISKIHGQIIFAAADCTGHGIPGAMLTMLCYNFLDIAVNDHNLTDPVAILKFVFNKLEALIYRQTGKSVTGDGMDIAICSFQPDILLLSYAGINRPLYLIQNKEIREIKAIRHLGNKSDIINNNSLNSQRILLNKGDQFYIFSDGFTDQFGGESKPTRKIGTKAFASFLLEICNLSMPNQRESLIKMIENWKQIGNERQTDDVMVIGVRI